MTLHDQSLMEIHEGLKKRQFSVTELVQASQARIDAVESHIDAFLARNEGVLDDAKRLDEVLTSGATTSPLFGIPYALKDNITTKGIVTTNASRMLESYVPVFDATVAERLHGAQAVLMGKLNLDEFAMGSTTESSAFKRTRNPWNTDYVPGGSSGGSAAAVAAGEVYFSLGSDTGGSIRQPASFNGIVGMKPSYGLVSRYGVFASASSLDTVGPLAKTVEDAAYVLQAIAGYDRRDSTSVNVADTVDYVRALTGDVRGLKIGLPTQYFGTGIDAEVKETVRTAVRVLESMGAIVEEVSLPHTEYAVATYFVLGPAEASSNFARFDGVRYGRRVEGGSLLDLYVDSRSQGFGREVKKRLMFGTYCLSAGNYDAYYIKAQKVRTLIRQDFDHLFATYDVLIGPATPTTAFRFGEYAKDPLMMYEHDVLSVPANLAGIPAVSVPAGFAANGMPVGMQILGKAFDEATVLRVAHAYEQATEHHRARATL